MNTEQLKALDSFFHDHLMALARNGKLQDSQPDTDASAESYYTLRDKDAQSVYLEEYSGMDRQRIEGTLAKVLKGMNEKEQKRFLESFFALMDELNSQEHCEGEISAFIYTL